MSTLAQSLVTWDDFLRLPERPEAGKRYELHDGEVVLVPPPRAFHIKVQKQIEELLVSVAGKRGVVTMEFPYRPAPNLQYWVADLAYVPRDVWNAMPLEDYPIYAPPLIIEVLSPSNRAPKINRQRIVAMSAGTQEFWVVDKDQRTVQVTDLSGTKVYGAGDSIPLALIGGGTIAVDEIFQPLLGQLP